MCVNRHIITIDETELTRFFGLMIREMATEFVIVGRIHLVR